MSVLLADKSALEWARRDKHARAAFLSLRTAHVIAACHVTALEICYSARNQADLEALLAGQRPGQPMSQSERFISLEGIEGAGKSMLARTLEAALRARGLSVLVTREPGGSPLAERLRTLVLERGPECITPAAETLLMFAAR